MSRVDFYHLQKQTLENVLPLLLQKVFSGGKRAVIRIGNPAHMDDINSYLWTYRDDSFLPHGNKKDGFAEQQPIWLTTEKDNPNHAEYLFLIEGAEANADEIVAYDRVFNIFDGNSEEALTQARGLWTSYKSAGCEVFYWQQNNTGKWEQKA